MTPSAGKVPRLSLRVFASTAEDLDKFARLLVELTNELNASGDVLAFDSFVFGGGVGGSLVRSTADDPVRTHYGIG